MNDDDDDDDSDVDLCATMMVVLPSLARSSADCTVASLAESRAEVASSSSRMRGFRTSALTPATNLVDMFAQIKFMYVHLAMAILCFCPPLSWAPLSPTKVSNFLGSF